MKTPFRQQAAGSCGLYVLANLFNRADFLADARPGIGHNTYQLNQLLMPHVDGEAYICDDYVLPLGAGRITDHTILFRFEDDNAGPEAHLLEPGRCLLYLLVTTNATQTMLHVVGAVHEARKGGRLWVVDSLREEVQETTLAAYFAQNHVSCIANFRLNRPVSAGHSDVALWLIERFAHITGPLAC